MTPHRQNGMDIGQRNMISYRADIDGLRAVAVLGVVLCHANIGGFPGGYVGVDIFFVISGYLITCIIVSDVDSSRFSFLAFYDRRVRRILPALFAMLGLGTLAAVAIFSPREIIVYAQSMLSVVLLSSNFFFWRTQDYFGDAAAEVPLIHTWSLSVEEQFYILFPPFLVGLLKYSGRNGAVRWIFTLVILSLITSIVGTSLAPTATFYLLPMRAWELALGALIALRAIPIVPKTLAEVMTLIGAALVVVPIIMYNSDTPFPGLAAVPPCLGAAMIIQAGLRDGVGWQKTLVGRVLAMRSMTFIGSISYSFYLVHWPVLVFQFLFLARPVTVSERVWAVAASFLIAVLSWRYVEQPFRRLPASAALSVRRISAAALTIGLFGLLCTALVSSDGLAIFSQASVRAADAAYLDVNPLRRWCQAPEESHTVPAADKCLAGAKPLLPRYDWIVWGDSHGNSYVPGIAEVAERQGLVIRQATKNNCPPLLGVDVWAETKPSLASSCRRFNEAVFAEIEARRPSLVVLSARWSVWSETTKTEADTRWFLIDDDDATPNKMTSRRVLSQALRETVRKITDIGIPVLILAQVPEFSTSPWRCLVRAYRFGRDPVVCSADQAEIDKRLEFSNELIADVVRSSSVASAFFPIEHLCNGQRCNVERDGALLYRDGNHISNTGARLVGGEIPLEAAMRAPAAPHGATSTGDSPVGMGSNSGSDTLQP